jgi:hypothetical protein
MIGDIVAVVVYFAWISDDEQNACNISRLFHTEHSSPTAGRSSIDARVVFVDLSNDCNSHTESDATAHPSTTARHF